MPLNDSIRLQVRKSVLIDPNSAVTKVSRVWDLFSAVEHEEEEGTRRRIEMKLKLSRFLPNNELHSLHSHGHHHQIASSVTDWMLPLLLCCFCLKSQEQKQISLYLIFQTWPVIRRNPGCCDSLQLPPFIQNQRSSGRRREFPCQQGSQGSFG